MKKNKFAIILGLLAVFLYTVPYLIFRQDSAISAWDNLDSYFVWYKTIAKYGWFLPLNFVIPEFMDGLPRNVFHSEFIFQVAIFNFLTPLKAYIVVDVLGRLIGFFGAYLLLKDYILKNDEKGYVSSGLALCFAFIPNYLTLTFLTLLGQPLWLWTFLNIRGGNYKYYNWIILTLIPCCVNFELITPFFLTFVGCIWFYDLITKKKLNPVFLGSIFYCAFISLITIYRFIYISFFDKDFVSHRKDWSLVGIQTLSLQPFWESVCSGIKKHIYNNGESCSCAMNKLIMLPVFLFSTIYALVKKLEERKLMLFIWGFMFFAAILYGIMFHYTPVLRFIDNVEVLKQFQVSRFYFLMPIIWIIAFALALKVILKSFPKFGKYFIFVFIVAQFIYAMSANHYFKNTIMNIFKPQTSASYRQYFAEKQFEDIKNYIGRPQNEYKVAVLGLLPLNGASYNGFHCINGYFNMFSLPYKRKLNEMNANLLEKNIAYKMLLKYWGHQQMIYWDEHYFDTNVMKELGTEYLLSDRPVIPLDKNSKVKYLKTFNYPNSIYTIYLYELIK